MLIVLRIVNLKEQSHFSASCIISHGIQRICHGHLLIILKKKKNTWLYKGQDSSRKWLFSLFTLLNTSVFRLLEKKKSEMCCNYYGFFSALVFCIYLILNILNYRTNSTAAAHYGLLYLFPRFKKYICYTISTAYSVWKKITITKSQVWIRFWNLAQRLKSFELNQN